jgi:hypothetical protein
MGMVPFCLLTYLSMSLICFYQNGLTGIKDYYPCFDYLDAGIVKDTKNNL